MAAPTVTATSQPRTRPNWGRRLLIAVVALAVLAGVVVAGLSIYVAGSLTDAYRAPVDTAVAASIGANYSDVSFPSRQQVSAGILLLPRCLFGSLMPFLSVQPRAPARLAGST